MNRIFAFEKPKDKKTFQRIRAERFKKGLRL